MDTALFLELTQGALIAAAIIAIPILIPGLITGIFISLFQAVTQISEQTLTFVPKLLIMMISLMLAGPLLLRYIMNYSSELVKKLPQIAQAGF